MKKIRTRILSILLALFMMMSILPITALADYADGDYCEYCGRYNWDDARCGDCGNCGEEGSYTCYIEHHCEECGECFANCGYYCEDCRWCWECLEGGTGTPHCVECYECMMGDMDELCHDCNRCANCAGSICEDCGFCEDCINADNIHCLLCGACYSQVDRCEQGGEHCVDCCLLCDQCGECRAEADDLCSDCGLCESCCLENSESEGCSCGMCVLSSEWDEHFCEECSVCFDEADQCDQCYLCVDCCASNSECDEGMCVEDPEYADHFCEDCGTCFHTEPQCETCADNGALRCETCCENVCAAAGCDCGTWCCEDPDFEEHVKTEHADAGSAHTTAEPQSSWSFDSASHWHDCKFCNDTSHQTGTADHTYNAYGVCTVCGFRNGETLYIKSQPKSVRRTVSYCDAAESDPLYYKNNKATFKVSALSTTKSRLHYQWYSVTDGGTPWKLPESEWYQNVKTNTLTIQVDTQICAEDKGFFCVVTDDEGNKVTSATAKLRGAHTYINTVNVDDPDDAGTKISLADGSSITIEKSLGHNLPCACEGGACGKWKYRVPQPHTFGAYDKEAITAADGKTYYTKHCTQCGYTAYVEKHEHQYEFNIDNWKTDTTATTHTLHCTVDGCEAERVQQHSWGAWQVVALPHGDTPGGIHRQCLVCDYDTTYEEMDSEHSKYNWTGNNILINTIGGWNTHYTAVPGDAITITLQLTPAEKKTYADQKCIGWSATYQWYDADGVIHSQAVTIPVAQSTENSRQWTCTVPSYANLGVTGGGGILTFKPSFTACGHTKDPVIENAVEAVCMCMGYTGDSVCPDCGHVFSTGQDIAAPSTGHQGTLTLIEGTAVTGSCTERGYEGDFRCSLCHKIQYGKKTGFHHANTELRDAVSATVDAEGYTGDLYCTDCEKIVKNGRVLPKKIAAQYALKAVDGSNGNITQIERNCSCNIELSVPESSTAVYVWERYVPEQKEWFTVDFLTTKEVFPADGTSGASSSSLKIYPEQMGKTAFVDGTWRCKVTEGSADPVYYKATIKLTHKYETYKPVTGSYAATKHAAVCAVCGSEDMQDHVFKWKADTEAKTHHGTCVYCGYQTSEKSYTVDSGSKVFVTMYLNGRETSDSSQVKRVLVTQNATCTVGSTFTARREGQTLEGWALRPNSTVPDYTMEDTIHLAENVVLYAVWKERTSFTLSGTVSSWNGTDNAVYRLYADSMTDEEIQADIKLASPTKGMAPTTLYAPELDGVYEGSYSQTYVFNNVLNGGYKLAVYKPEGYLVSITPVTVKGFNLKKFIQLYLTGDVTGDGKVNTKDWIGVKKHINETESLTGYALLCGDVTGDGKINTKDMVRIKKHINETELLW